MRFTCESTLPLTMAVPQSASAVEAWLGQQLEMRGIDALIYSRYILNLLQQDEPDPIPLSPPAYPSAARRYSLTDCAAVSGAKSKNRSRKVEKRRSCDFDLDEQRKMAAIKCLLSATDETSGIESFVDELYMKLKEAETAKDTRGELGGSAPASTSDSPTEPETPQDPAQRYYAAFPALSDRCSNLTPTVGASGDKVWAKVARTPKTDQSDSTDSEDKTQSSASRESTPETGSTKRAKSKKEKDLYNLANKYTGRFSPRSPGSGNSSPKTQKDRQLKKTPPHMHSARHMLPGVESPKFRMYTFKGKSIDHIKGKSLFQDVEGDIGPPAISATSKSTKPATVMEYSHPEECSAATDVSSEMADGASCGPKVPNPPPFVLPEMKSPGSMTKEMVDKDKKRKPLYLRRSSIDQGQVTTKEHVVVLIDTDSQDCQKMDSVSDEQTTLVEDVWMGKQYVEDMFPQPDASRPRLYERNVKVGEECADSIFKAVAENVLESGEGDKPLLGDIPMESTTQKIETGPVSMETYPDSMVSTGDIDDLVRDLFGYQEPPPTFDVSANHVTEEPWMSEHAIEAVNQYHRGSSDQGGKRLFAIGKSTDESVMKSASQDQLSDWFNESFDMQPPQGENIGKENTESALDVSQIQITVAAMESKDDDYMSNNDKNQSKPDENPASDNLQSPVPAKENCQNADSDMNSTNRDEPKEEPEMVDHDVGTCREMEYDRVEPDVISRRKEIEHRQFEVADMDGEQSDDSKLLKMSVVDSSASIEMLSEFKYAEAPPQTDSATTEVKELVFKDESPEVSFVNVDVNKSLLQTRHSLENVMFDSSTSLSTAAIEVPPNTPVNQQDFSPAAYGSQQSHSHHDILGLSNLIQLAEQIKSLSQDDSDIDQIGAAFFSQEPPSCAENPVVDANADLSGMVAWESLESLVDDDVDGNYMSPGEIAYPITVAIDPLRGGGGQAAKSSSPDIVHSFMQLFDSPSSSLSRNTSSSSFDEMFSDIPTPLSSEEDESLERSSVFSRWQPDASRETSKEPMMKSGNVAEQRDSLVSGDGNKNGIDDKAEENEVSLGSSETSGRVSPEMLAVQLGYTEMLKKIEVKKSGESESKQQCKQLNQETNANQNLNTTAITSSAILSTNNQDQNLAAVSKNNVIDSIHTSTTSPVTLKACSFDDSILVPSAMLNSVVAKRLKRSASCDIEGQSRLQVWWELAGKSRKLWSGLGGSTGILTGELKDLLWQERAANLWKMESDGLLEGIVLAKGSPDLDNEGMNGVHKTSPLGNNGVVITTPPGSYAGVLQPSPLREYFSPQVQRGGESRIWDVNVPGQLDLSGSFDSNTFNLAPASVTQILGQLTYAASYGIHMTFIEGGLYGKEWKELLDSSSDMGRPSSSVSDRQSDTSSVKLPTDKYWGSSSDNAQSDDDEMSISSSSCITNATDILPSENSAFAEFSRSCSDDEGGGEPSQHYGRGLHQVQSEPIISPMKHCTQGLEATYRLIQVKHLYKSDTSILRQLGLASGNDDEELQQTDTVEFSPDRHFRPISTLLASCGQGQGHVSPAETVSDTVTVVPEDVYNTEKESLDGSWNGSYKSSSFLRSSSYQLYMEQGQLLEESNTGENEPFVPSFRVEKKYEKFAQTGDDTPSPPPANDNETDQRGNEQTCESSLTERLLTDMKKVLGYDDAADSGVEKLTLKDLDKSILHNELNSSDYESMGGQDTSGDDENGGGVISDYQPTGIAGIWEQTSQANTSESNPTTHPTNTHHTHTVPTASSVAKSGSKFQSIWSVGLDNNIAVVLQVSEAGHQSSEAEKIQESGLKGEALLDAYAAAIDNFEDYLYQDTSSSFKLSRGDGHSHTHLYSTRRPRNQPEWMRDDVIADVFTDEEGDLMFALEVQPGLQQPDVPASQRLFSSDLENEWRTNNNNFTVQVPKYSKPKNKLGGCRKPCSFFMEGNCRRQDCKFAHDVSTITCRFWEEGECFKGVTCPFLHGYYRESSVRESPKPSGRKKERRRHSAKRHSSSSKEAEFTLRKDDFPILSKSQGATVDENVTSSSGSDNKGVARPIPAKSSKAKDRSKVKAKSLPIDINFKSKSTATA